MMPDKVKEIALEILEVLEKHYPYLTKKKFDNHGYPNKEGSPALNRIELCVYIELLKAGAFNEALL